MDLDLSTKSNLITSMKELTSVKKRRLEELCEKFENLQDTNISELPLFLPKLPSLDGEIKAKKRSPTTATKKKKQKTTNLKPNVSNDVRRHSFGDWSPERLEKYIEQDVKSNFMKLFVKRYIAELFHRTDLEKAHSDLLNEMNRLKPIVTSKDLLMYVEHHRANRHFDREQLRQFKLKKILIGRAHCVTQKSFYDWNTKLINTWTELIENYAEEDLLTYCTDMLNEHFDNCNKCSEHQRILLKEKPKKK